SFFASFANCFTLSEEASFSNTVRQSRPFVLLWATARRKSRSSGLSLLISFFSTGFLRSTSSAQATGVSRATAIATIRVRTISHLLRVPVIPVAPDGQLAVPYANGAPPRLGKTKSSRAARRAACDRKSPDERAAE